VDAEQVMVLDEFNPEVISFGVFNSFKHHLLLVALTKKNNSTFDCHPNRYIFYDYGKEDYYELLSGSLKISSDYSQLIMSKIHTIVSLPEQQDNSEWKENIQALLSELNVSSITLENGKSVSTDRTVSCWQQPAIINFPAGTERLFPFLIANLCKQAWCSEFYWIDTENVQFWVHINPNELHLIRLNIKTGAFDFKKKTPKYFQNTFFQLNAPRENLVNDENINDGSFAINSQDGQRIRLHWKKNKNERIKLELTRNKEDRNAAENVRDSILKFAAEKKYTEALRLLKFGFWLSPNEFDLKIVKLKIFAALLLTDNFFKTLEDDFTKAERFEACQKLHIDESLKNLWQQKPFSNKFKELCF
jgi:hypothetical protein